MQRKFSPFSSNKEELSYSEQQTSFNSLLLIPFHIFAFLTMMFLSFIKFKLNQSLSPEAILFAFLLPLWFPLSIPLSLKFKKIWDYIILVDCAVLLIHICFISVEEQNPKTHHIQGFCLSTINLLLIFRLGNVGNFIGVLTTAIFPIIVLDIRWNDTYSAWPYAALNFFIIFMAERNSRALFSLTEKQNREHHLFLKFLIDIAFKDSINVIMRLTHRENKACLHKSIFRCRKYVSMKKPFSKNTLTEEKPFSNATSAFENRFEVIDIHWKRNISVEDVPLKENDFESFKTFLKSLKITRETFLSSDGSLKETRDEFFNSDILSWLSSFPESNDRLKILQASKHSCFKLRALYEKENPLETLEKKRFDIYITIFTWKGERRLFIRFVDKEYKKRIELLESVDQFKKMFLAQITHDLRAPLLGVQSMIDSVVEESDLTKRAEILRMANINCELLLNLINDILDYSLAGKKSFKISCSLFPLQGLLDEVIHLMQIQAAFRRIELKLVNFCEKNLVVYSDSKRLKQVLINLLNNSLKFTIHGHVHLYVSPAEKNTKELIKFEIIDSGVGLKQSEIFNLGTPFNSFESTSMNPNGIGLGLYNCKQILAKLGPEGSLHVSSIEGKGSKFGFLIFADYTKRQEMHAIDEKVFSDFNETLSGESHNEIPLNGEDSIVEESSLLIESTKLYNILIADDDSFNVMVLGTIINKNKVIDKEKINLENVSNGRSAVELFIKRNRLGSTRSPINLIIMDCQMPIKDGFSACRDIQGLVATGQYRAVSIVGLTSFIEEEQMIKAQTSGMKEIIVKPATNSIVDKLLLDYLIPKID